MGSIMVCVFVCVYVCVCECVYMNVCVWVCVCRPGFWINRTEGTSPTASLRSPYHWIIIVIPDTASYPSRVLVSWKGKPTLGLRETQKLLVNGKATLSLFCRHQGPQRVILKKKPHPNSPILWQFDSYVRDTRRGIIKPYYCKSQVLIVPVSGAHTSTWHPVWSQEAHSEKKQTALPD